MKVVWIEGGTTGTLGGGYIAERSVVILSLGCFLKGFIVSVFLVCGLPDFITYLRFVYIFPNSLYSKF